MVVNPDAILQQALADEMDPDSVDLGLFQLPPSTKDRFMEYKAPFNDPLGPRPPYLPPEYEPSDEQLLDQVQQAMGDNPDDDGPFTGDYETDRLILMRAPTEANMQRFKRIHEHYFEDSNMYDDLEQPPRKEEHT